MTWDFKARADRMEALDAAELKAEMAAYRAEFNADGIGDKVLERAARVSWGSGSGWSKSA